MGWRAIVPVDSSVGQLAGDGRYVSVGCRDELTVDYGDPRLRWLRAAKLARELGNCTVVEPDELHASTHDAIVIQ